MQLLKNMCLVNSMGVNVKKCLRYIQLKKLKEVAGKESGLYYIFIYFVFKIHTFNYKSSTHSWKHSKKHTSRMAMGGREIFTFHFI